MGWCRNFKHATRQGFRPLGVKVSPMNKVVLSGAERQEFEELVELFHIERTEEHLLDDSVLLYITSS